jgi:hypothetical protein
MSSWISGTFFVWLNYYEPYRKTRWFIPNKTKKHCYTGSTRNWNLYSVLGNSKGRSSVSVTQAVACDRSAALALWIKLSLRKLALLPHIFKSYLRVVICCWLSYAWFPRSWAGCSQGIMETAFMSPVRLKFPFNRARSGWQVPDSLATAFRSKNKANPNLILEIAKRYVKYLN